MDAGDGEEALRILAGGTCRPAVAIVDLAMPVMDGHELVPLLAERYPGLSVIVSSGYPEEEARRGFASQPPLSFIQKPYTAASLIARVDEALAAAGMA